MQNLQGYIFLILQHFGSKLRNIINFNMLFLAVVMDFVLPAQIQKLESSIRKVLITGSIKPRG
jgi:hypothetical protein